MAINYRSYFTINSLIVGLYALSQHPLETNPLNKTSMLEWMLGQCTPISITKFKRSTNGFNRSSDLNSAIKTMEYHREMFKDYQISSYLAHQIANSLPMLEMYTPLQHRMGGSSLMVEPIVLNTTNYTNLLNPQQYSTASCQNFSSSIPFSQKLLQDKGSQRYLSWLYSMLEAEKKRNTMHQRPFHDLSSINSESQAFNAKINRRKSLRLQSNTSDMNDKNEDDNGDNDDDDNDKAVNLEDGQIIAYTYPVYNPSIINDLEMQPAKISQRKKLHIHLKGTPTGSTKGYTAKAAASAEHTVYRAHKKTSDIGLKEVADIAFTTLAYLSFGLFILQVLMCITMTKDDTKNFALPMENPDNGDLNGSVEEVRRKRRSILTVEEQRLIQVNNITQRVLLSLKAVSHMAKDNGSCHYYLLCENNKYATKQKGIQKLWIPIWSLGVTWLAGKLNTHNETIPWRSYLPILNSIKAVLIGLSKGSCNKYYNSKCNLE